jgi:hypothetical protein
MMILVFGLFFGLVRVFVSFGGKYVFGSFCGVCFCDKTAQLMIIFHFVA